MDNKYCRICWNTTGWRYPTGEAHKLETGGSYVAENGFGHEEWLFNFEWILQGYRYGFLQPIGKYRTKYQRNAFSVILYTVTPERETLIVGQINNLYVPDYEELSQAVVQMQRKGWVQQMIEDVASIGGNVAKLSNPEPDEIANVRFYPQDVSLFDPMHRVIGNHKILRLKRYQPIDWSDDFPQVSRQPPSSSPDDPRRSEHERTRAAQEASKFDPKHVRLQNRLYDALVQQHGPDAVAYEQDFIDLLVRSDGVTTFYEVKTENTARKCLRYGIGQLLEYTHYPDVAKADKLVIVGDAPPSVDDEIYLNTIRNRYSLPIFYGWFNWETESLYRVI